MVGEVMTTAWSFCDWSSTRSQLTLSSPGWARMNAWAICQRSRAMSSCHGRTIEVISRAHSRMAYRPAARAHCWCVLISPAVSWMTSWKTVSRR